jgi:methylenetetrahydrofolate reductase (NADPH)
MTMKVKTKLAQALSNGKPALTAECLPPLSASPAALGKLHESLPEYLDAIVVSDHHLGSGGSALACAALLAARRREPVLPVVTRDKNRIALESDVLGAATLGVRSFLCVSGAHQSLGAGRMAAGVHDIDSTQLLQALGRMTSESVGFAGEPLDSPPDLFIGAVAHPYLRPLELGLIELRKKIAAGAQALWTDPVGDLEGFEQWMNAMRVAGLDRKVAIIASVMPVPGAEQPSKPAGAELDRCADVARKLRAMSGVRGIHFMFGGCEESVSRVITAANLA